MCIHCCRLNHSACPPIPYSCPHCSVRKIASACCVAGQKYCNKIYSEHNWYMVRTNGKHAYPCICHRLPARWLDVNRNLIFKLSHLLDQSPESVHYILLRLLHANYSHVMRIMKKRRGYEVPLASQALFFSPNSLIDESGNLHAPMNPESVEKLLRLIQDYLHRMQMLNRKYRWFKNGMDKGDLVGLLGELDELLKLLRSIYGGCNGQDLINMQRLLQVLNYLDLDGLFKKSRAQSNSSQSLKGISDLYSEVAAENPEIENKITSEPPQLSLSDSVEPIERYSEFLAEPFPAVTSSIGSFKSAVSVRRDPSKKYLFGEFPVAFHEPFDEEKPWTWLSRMPQRERLMQDGTIRTAPVRRYRPIEAQARLARMRDKMSIRSERSLIEGTQLRSTLGKERPTLLLRKSAIQTSQKNSRKSQYS